MSVCLPKPSTQFSNKLAPVKARLQSVYSTDPSHWIEKYEQVASDRYLTFLCIDFWPYPHVVKIEVSFS